MDRRWMGHAALPISLPVHMWKETLNFIVKISTDNNDLNIDANRKKEECIFSISKPKLKWLQYNVVEGYSRPHQLNRKKLK